MVHRQLREMLDEMLNDPDKVFITSNSRHSALISLEDGTTLFIQGDFSGTDEENEVEVRRILTEQYTTKERKSARKPRNR